MNPTFVKVEVAVEVATNEEADEKPPTTRFLEMSNMLKVDDAVVEVALNVLAARNPPKTAFLDTSRRPAKVEVAVVDVAIMEATVGVDEAISAPLVFVVTTMLVPKPENVAVPVAIKLAVVSVPDTIVSP